MRQKYCFLIRRLLQSDCIIISAKWTGWMAEILVLWVCAENAICIMNRHIFWTMSFILRSRGVVITSKNIQYSAFGGTAWDACTDRGLNAWCAVFISYHRIRKLSVRCIGALRSSDVRSGITSQREHPIPWRLLKHILYYHLLLYAVGQKRQPSTFVSIFANLNIASTVILLLVYSV